ncbi:MAG: hypothetical protein KGI33_06590 [Thaumarchaeota archaeon]|nr:hypothetical protein [Nitrososphaerota archaeon]
MLGKLIIIGIIAVGLAVVLPGLLRGGQHAGPLQTLKERIDYATASHPGSNSTGYAGYGGILATGQGGGNQSGRAAGLNSGTPQGTPASPAGQSYTGQVFRNENGTCQVSVPGMAQTVNGQTELTYVIQVPDCSLPVNRPVDVTVNPQQNPARQAGGGGAIEVVPFYYPGSGGGQNAPASGQGQASPSGQNSPPTAPPYFQTVQLDAVNQGTGVMLSYDDTTGKTTQVTVVMKNSQKTLFSGDFYSSQFHTEVNDIPNTPHMIEMTIQNSLYGTLHASVYAPSDIQNSTISGIFAN